jgi:hypothetical protein
MALEIGEAVETSNIPTTPVRDVANLVTDKDLKIAFFEFRRDLDEIFHKIDLRFNTIEAKLSLAMWFMGITVSCVIAITIKLFL